MFIYQRNIFSITIMLSKEQNKMKKKTANHE